MESPYLGCTHNRVSRDVHLYVRCQDPVHCCRILHENVLDVLLSAPRWGIASQVQMDSPHQPSEPDRNLHRSGLAASFPLHVSLAALG